MYSSFWRFVGQATANELCCLDSENSVGSRKTRATNTLVIANCLPEGSGVLLPSALRRGGCLAACCCVFTVGDPRKHFPDDASLRLSAILEHHSRGDRILPPKATKVSQSRGENNEFNTSSKFACLRVIFQSGWLGARCLNL